MEIWKDIKNYDGLYQISNLGNVKSLSKKVNFKNWKTLETNYRITNEKILKNKNVKGYNTVILCKNNIKKNYRVCRLVAIAFLENNKNKSQVNHIDGNKKNDNLNNLEWNTPSENMKHAVKNKLTNYKKGEKHYSSKKVICTKTNKIYGNIKIASKEFNISPSHLSRVLRNIKTNYTTLKLLNA